VDLSLFFLSGFWWIVIKTSEMFGQAGPLLGGDDSHRQRKEAAFAPHLRAGWIFLLEFGHVWETQKSPHEAELGEIEIIGS
jgi:hypothetical protein